MSDPVQPEIEFPVDWTYRVLCENTPVVKTELCTLLDALGEHSFESGNISKTGKYITYKIVKKAIPNYDELRDLPKRLAVISGVKQVL